MIVVPTFSLHGAQDRAITESIQSTLALRGWGELGAAEKMVIFRELANRGWIDDESSKILETVSYLNSEFLRLCPGKRLHAVAPIRDRSGSIRNQSARKEAAYLDFQKILLESDSEPLVFRMLSKLLSLHIDSMRYTFAKDSTSADERARWIEEAFHGFDRIANCVNHCFEQFAINQVVTRNGFVPRQDEKIIADIYEPTLRTLSDPKWKAVSDDLANAFQDYRDQKYAEAITKAHAAMQRFLQVLVGEDGKNGRGEVGKLYQEAKKRGLIDTNHFSEQFVNLVQGAIVSARATNSTAKPTTKATTAGDALLTLNLVLVFLQHSLTGPT